MDFNARVLQVIQPILRDADDPFTLSPCILKEAIIEVATLVYREDGASRLYDALVKVLYYRDMLNEQDMQELRAFPSLFGLCSRYLLRGVCSHTVREILLLEDNLALLRGGVRRLSNLGRSRIARSGASIPYKPTYA